VTIEPARPEHADAMLAQTRAAIAGYRAFAPPGWDPAVASGPDHLDRIRATIANPQAIAVVAHAGDRLVAHMAWRPEDERGHLLALFVEPAAWGSGIATELHDRAIAGMRERGYCEASLYTPAGNARARRFYEREGWAVHGEPGFSEIFGLDLIEYRLEL
jgi:GNAT superfamily N-acetyltransferase